MENKYKEKLQSAEGLTKIEILIEIALETLDDSPEESNYYNQQALDLIDLLDKKNVLNNQKKNKILNLNIKALIIKAKILYKFHNIVESCKIFNSILEFDQEQIEKESLLEVYRNLSEILEEDDLESALGYFEKYVKLKDEIHQIEKDRLIAIIESEYKLERKQKQAEIFKLRNIELVESNQKLMEALEEINTLNKLLPICASCKKIRNDNGYWEMIENYIENHSEAQLFNSLCPDCAKK